MSNKELEEQAYKLWGAPKIDFVVIKENVVYEADRIQTKEIIYDSPTFYFIKDFVVVFAEWHDTFVINRNLIEIITNIREKGTTEQENDA